MNLEIIHMAQGVRTIAESSSIIILQFFFIFFSNYLKTDACQILIFSAIFPTSFRCTTAEENKLCIQFYSTSKLCPSSSPSLLFASLLVVIFQITFSSIIISNRTSRAPCSTDEQEVKEMDSSKLESHKFVEQYATICGVLLPHHSCPQVQMA